MREWRGARPLSVKQAASSAKVVWRTWMYGCQQLVGFRSDEFCWIEIRKDAPGLGECMHLKWGVVGKLLARTSSQPTCNQVSTYSTGTDYFPENPLSAAGPNLSDRSKQSSSWQALGIRDCE